ncbi:MAG TPA: ABC transporter permease [Gemmatimonadaceae bacterium]|nr:ABC transporter permease [Gemmatimonadaceae bacterium]
MQDLRYALRTLIRTPGFTIAAVVCLALGIGVNATVFSCMRAVLLRPFPYGNPDELVAIGESNPQRGWHMNSVSYPNFRSWQADNRTLSDVGTYGQTAYNLARDDGADFVQGGAVSWTMFHTLGVKPVYGRDFAEEDDRVGAPRVIILSDRLWRDRFNADPAAIGKEVTVSGNPATVIGVMPPGFAFPQSAAAWTPFRLDANSNRGNHSWNVIGRLKPGGSVEQVQTDLRRIASGLETQFPNSNKGWSVDVQTLREFQSGNIRPVLNIMMGAVALVLLIACANVANLLLSRAATRTKEMAVRLTLGAQRGRLIRQMLTESTLLALMGAALGIGVAYAFLQWIKAHILGGIPFWMQFTIDGPVLLFTIAVAVATGVLFGLAPALQSASPNLNETLRDAGTRGASAGRSRARLRSSLVVGEVALALVLLVGATLLIRSFLGLERIAPGFDPDNLLTMRVALVGPRYDSTYKRLNFWDQLLPQVAELPGVTSVGITNTIPLSGSNNNSFFDIEGRPAQTGQNPLLEVRWVSPDYLKTMRIPLHSGRMFTQQEWDDSSAAGRVVVIGQNMAEKLWPNGDAIGKRFTFGSATDSNPRWFTIVGVAADIKHRQLTQPPDYQGYIPFRQSGNNTETVVIRTAGDPSRVTAPVLELIKKLDPALPASRIMTMNANIEQSYWQQSLYGKMFGAFAAIALVLAAVGVYGVISYNVAQRTQEIGVRVALGARPQDILTLVVGNGALLGGIGVLIGLGGAFAVTRFLRTMLVGVSPFDPLSFAGVAVALTSVALVASYIPARRAARVDPVEAIRAD